MITPWHEGTPPKEIAMTTRTKTLAGASLVLALALTGCDGTGGAEETSTASAAPISTSPDRKSVV